MAGWELVGGCGEGSGAEHVSISEGTGLFESNVLYLHKIKGKQTV